MGNGAVADPGGASAGVSSHRGVGSCGWALAAFALLGSLLSAAPSARAEDQTVLVRLLEGSHSFRVRARAALALANGANDAAVGALEVALGDPHAAVREAAAAALGRVGARRSVSALRKASSDSSLSVAAQARNALRAIAARDALGGTPVRTAVGDGELPVPASVPLDKARYVLVVGEMRNRAAQGGPELEGLLAARVLVELRALPRVAVLTLDQMTEGIGGEIARRKLPAFRIDGTIGVVETTQVGDEQRMHCEVSLLVMDEPERTLRSMLKGAATGSEQLKGAREVQLRTLAQKALKGAVRSALGNVQEAVRSASVDRDLGASDLRAQASLEHRAR